MENNENWFMQNTRTITIRWLPFGLGFILFLSKEQRWATFSSFFWMIRIHFAKNESENERKKNNDHIGMWNESLIATEIQLVLQSS